MPIPASCCAVAVQALGFKCISYDNTLLTVTTVALHAVARRVQYPIPSLTKRSDVSVGILRQHFCETFLRGGVRATLLPNDADVAAATAAAPAEAAAAAETRACCDTVFPA